MFYLKSAAPKAGIEQMFGSTEKCAITTDDPLIFTYTSTPRLMFLQYRVKTVLNNTINVSPSISCVADDIVAKDGVMLKIFFLQHKDERQNIHRLLYETQVYKYVTNQLGPISSLFVPWIKTYMFSGSDLDVGNWKANDLDAYRKELKKSGHYEGYSELYKRFAAQVNVNMAFAQITKRDDNDMTLLSFLRIQQGSLDMLKQILFQCVFALACLAELRIQHNDVHVNNVLISFLSKTPKKGYYFKGQLFYAEQYLQIKLFDWDLAYVEALGPNQGLDDETFELNGVGNHFNSRYDLYMFLSSLEQFYDVNKITLPGPISQFIASVRPKLYQLDPIRLCNANVETKTCSLFPPGEPNDILTPQEALMLPLFDSYRVSKPVFQGETADGLYKFEIPAKPNVLRSLFGGNGSK